jgi:hypothetical protein
VTRTRRISLPALVLAAVVGLTGCATTVAMEPAPNADDPACAEVAVRLPATLAGEQRRWTDAQSTAAWGDPAAVLFTCGLEPPGPTTLPCREVDGVDWIIDDSTAPDYRVTSFGREPAVEIYLDNDVVSSAEVLDGLSLLVARLPTTGATCLDRTDVETGTDG